MPDTRATLLLTRPERQATRFATACRAAIGVDIPVVISPVIEIVPRALTVNLRNFDGVVLTSENAVAVLAQITEVRGVAAFCVGDRTAEIARGYGMIAKSAKGNASDLVRMIARDKPRGVLLHAHGAHTRGEVAEKLGDLDLRIETACIYDQRAVSLSQDAHKLLVQNGRVILPLFSPRTAALVSAEIQQTQAHLYVVALSNAVKDAWKGQMPQKFTVADQPNAPHMIDEIAAIWSSLHS